MEFIVLPSNPPIIICSPLSIVISSSFLLSQDLARLQPNILLSVLLVSLEWCAYTLNFWMSYAFTLISGLIHAISECLESIHKVLLLAFQMNADS